MVGVERRARAQRAAPPDPATRRVVVYGAYGHTGRFVTAELRRRGLVPVLSGRDPDRLAAFGAAHPDLEVRRAAVDDPDAPRGTWVHWVLYNIPAQARALPEGAKHLPPGTREGENDGGRTGYTGPCPPVGRHRYFHRLYALDAVLPDLGPAPSWAKVEAAMRAHVIAQAELVGTYQKASR